MTTLKTAAAKVIATGDGGGDRLRATVILTPPTSSEYGAPEITQSLRDWPGSLIRWLRTNCFKIFLEASEDPGGKPPKTFSIEATASGMASVWGGRGDIGWVERLWEQIFSCSGKGIESWKALAQVLWQATSQGTGGPGVPAEVKGVPQSELSIVLECNRALELCNSVRAIGEKIRECRVKVRQEEIAYLPTPAQVDTNVDKQPDLKCKSSLTLSDFANRSRLATQLEELIECYQEANAPDANVPPKPDASAQSQPTPSSPGSGSVKKPDGNGASDADPAVLEQIRHIFYSLQSSPTFSRLFGLAIDVTFPASCLNELPEFFYLSVCSVVGDKKLCAVDGKQKLLEGLCHPIHVLTQYSKPDPTSFWPATQEERQGLSRWLYRGVAVNTDPVQTKGKTPTPRFELSSLDVRRAAEAAIDRRLILSGKGGAGQSKADERSDKIRGLQDCIPPRAEGPAENTEAKCKDFNTQVEDLTCRLTVDQLERLVSKTPLRPAALSRKTYHTGGFTLLDRGRGDQAAGQLKNRGAHAVCGDGSPILLCANDLLTGYRVDVGVPKSEEESCCNSAVNDNYHWRGLMARRVVYGDHGHASMIEHVAPRLFIEVPSTNDPEMGWRTCLEDGYHGLTARVIDKTGHAEEALFAWTAEPMGAPMSGYRNDKVAADPTGCGRRVIAPSATVDAARRIPALRFGCHYVFAVRAVFPGGISLPLAVAKNLYHTPPSTPVPVVPASAPPCGSLKPVRRFLRHERIDAPLLLLPEEIAMRRHGPMGYESAAHAIVRTVFGKVRDREQPTFTQRIFIAPGVSRALASMHGVFDNFSGACPREGLSAPRFGPSGVRRDPRRGGFPMIVSDHITGINGYPYPAGRHTAASALGDAAEAGDMLYSFGPHPAPDRNNRDYVCYYPDPAANSFVIGVRFAGTDTYLGGRSRVIDARAGGYRFPDTRPLLLTVARTTTGKPRMKTPDLEEVVSVPGDPHYLAHRPPGAGHVPGAVEALVLLAPGDDFEVDVWCIPTVEILACRFALVESLSALCLQAVDSNDPLCQKEAAALTSAFCVGVKQLLPSLHDKVATTLKTAFDGSAGRIAEVADWKQAAIGPAGLTVPGPKVRQALATALFDFLSQYPLDEIAAFRTLRVTHATDTPSDPPRLLDENPDMKVGLVRTPGTGANMYPWTPQGKVDFNWPTTSSLELTAEMASPTSDRLDDVRRGRSLLDRRLGRWPNDANGEAALCPSRVYGFHVGANGEVTLCKTKGVALYRLDDLPLLDRGQFEKGTRDISSDLNLSKRFQPDSESSGAAWVGTGKYTFQFTDGLARQLLLSVTAYARHRDRMRTADPAAHNGRWLHQGKPLTPEQGSLTSTQPVAVWLDACVRPAEPATRTPFPLFRLSQDLNEHHCAPRGKRPVKAGKRLSRTVVVRIPIARPWFSSGEDEHLGIVLWPPNIFDHNAEDLERNYVWLETPAQDQSGTGSDRRWIKLDDFRDEDLGPAGKFITRWGGDPTRFPSEQLKHRTGETNAGAARPSLIPPGAFLDLYQESDTGFVPEKVSSVLMPIRVEEDSNTLHTSQPPAENPVIQTLAVSLLTYRPKFDISEEQWYVDVAIEHPSEAEPFVRLGLVRYQPHADENLQVSFPVVQWTQLLPRRTVEVKRSGPCVTIRIEGLATSPYQSRIEEKLQSESKSGSSSLSQDAKESLPTSQMIARIVREAKGPLGVPIRTLECESAFCEQEIKYTQLEQGTYQAVWCKEVDLERFNPRQATYYVIVEERDMRLPATYPSEPVSPAQATGRDKDGCIDETLLIQSGLRFSAKMMLK